MKKDVDTVALEAFEAATRNIKDATLVRLLTEKEQVVIGRRPLIANAILAGKTRAEINNKIRVSPNTYRQMRRWLQKEGNQYSSAYRVPKAGLHDSRKDIVPFSYEHLTQKYPSHFLLFTLVEELWGKNESMYHT